MNKVGDLLAEFDLGFGTPYQVIDILIPIIVGYIIGYILYIGYIYIYTAILLSLLLKEVMVQSWKNQSKTIAENFAAPLSLQNLFASSWKNVSTTYHKLKPRLEAMCKCLQETNGQTVGSALARPGSLEKGLVPP